MEHKMKLVDFAFNKIKSGEKNIEIRLNDEKRKLINIGDIIEFTNIDTREIIKVKVVNLYKYKSFKDLFDNYDNKSLGLSKLDTYEIMNNFYSIEDQEKYGALAIEIKLI